MMNGSDDGEGGLFNEATPEVLAGAEDSDLLALGTALLAELKDRGLLRVLLRNRVDAATAFEVEAIRAAEDGLDVVAAGYHAETPADYPGWVAESAALLRRLGTPGLSEQDAEAMLGEASDEALLLTLDSAHLAEEESQAIPIPPPDSAADGIGTRVALELLRRGVIEAEAEE